MARSSCNDSCSPYDGLGLFSLVGGGGPLAAQIFFCFVSIRALNIMFFPKELDFVEGFAGKGEVSSAFRKVACQVFLLFGSCLFYNQHHQTSGVARLAKWVRPWMLITAVGAWT